MIRIVLEEIGVAYVWVQPGALIVITLVVALRPVEVRLWRAGRLSDELLSALLAARFPVVVATFLVASGAPPDMILVAVLLAAAIGGLVYRAAVANARSRSRPAR